MLGRVAEQDTDWLWLESELGMSVTRKETGAQQEDLLAHWYTEIPPHMILLNVSKSDPVHY